MRNSLWVVSAPGFVKINVDGSFKGSMGVTGIELVSKNDKGVLVGGLEGVVKADSPFMMECIASFAV